jgi:hypothetical protein
MGLISKIYLENPETVKGFLEDPTRPFLHLWRGIRLVGPPPPLLLLLPASASSKAKFRILVFSFVFVVFEVEPL